VADLGCHDTGRPHEQLDLPEAARRPRAAGLAQHEGAAGLTGRPFVEAG